MKIQIWYNPTPNGGGALAKKFSEPESLFEAIVDIRRCQVEHKATDISIELLDIGDGDI